MPANKKLAIAVPTYNRADILDFFLQTYVPVVREHDIAIYISNNGSSDNTLEVVEKWQQQYPYIVCSTFEKTVDVDENVQKALSLSEAEYTWVTGDGFEIPPKTLDMILDILPDDGTHYDFIVTDLVGRKREVEEKVFTDKTETLEKLGWIISCLGCTIFHRNAIQNGHFEKYRYTGFGHVGVVFDYITKPGFRLYWAPDAIIVSLKSPVRKPGWGSYFFVNIFETWPNVIALLPDSYSDASKTIARRALQQKTGILRWRYLLGIRAQGILDRESYKKYGEKLREVTSDLTMMYVWILTFMPKGLCAVAIKTIEWFRRKNYQIRKALNPNLMK
ncbi:glycosyltransferase family 2 protein [Magnetovibrio sp.]|uniref:glycosyltransferase family 2 protein n=1 Tax=Magnetovibrio sp. TaxID=2024836 RepID=UPI002F93AF32